MASKVRPWQGTVLGVLCYIGVALAVIAAGMMLFGGTLLGGMMSGVTSGVTGMMNAGGELPAESAAVMSGAAGMMGGFLGAFGMLAAVFILIGGGINYLIGKAVMAGKKWSLIVIIVFSALGVLSALSPFDAVSLVISGVLVALPVSVLKDPYYNSKN